MCNTTLPHQPRAETRRLGLKFRAVPDGSSMIKPLTITFEDPWADDVTSTVGLGLQVVRPPLAPFSIAESPGHYRWALPGRDDASKTHRCLWVRYDATSATSRDHGTMIVGLQGTEAIWHVALYGFGTLHTPQQARPGSGQVAHLRPTSTVA